MLPDQMWEADTAKELAGLATCKVRAAWMQDHLHSKM